MRSLTVLLFVTMVGAGFTYADKPSAQVAALRISVSADPPSQDVPAGMMGHTFTQYVLDATASAEDVRLDTFWVVLGYHGERGGAPTCLTSVQLWDGSVPLNTGTNVLNPVHMSPTGQSYLVTLDRPFIVPKGTMKILTLRGNIAPETPPGSIFSWGLAFAPEMPVTGITSGNAIQEEVAASPGQRHTVVNPGAPATERHIEVSWRVRMLEGENEEMRDLIRKAATPSGHTEGALDREHMRLLGKRMAIETLALNCWRAHEYEQDAHDSLLGIEYLRFKRLCIEVDEAMNRFRSGQNKG